MTDRQTEGHKDRQADGQANTWRERERERERQRQRRKKDDMLRKLQTER